MYFISVTKDCIEYTSNYAYGQSMSRKILTIVYNLTVVGDYTNTMKTTFDFDLDFHKQHGYT